MAATTLDPTASPGGGGRRTIAGLPAGPVALVLGAVVLLGALVTWRWVREDDASCGALLAPVESLDGYDWDNGITSSGSEWISVLTSGVTDADRASRDQIATAVAADEAGFERFRSALPDDLEPTADRLHALALDADESHRRRADPEVERDVAALNRHGTSACGVAP